jgi:hypothetical protein
VVDRLHQQVLQDVKDKPTVQHPWVSPGDVILAWLTRAVVKSSSRPISMTTLMDVRTRLPQLEHPKRVYMQNMILGPFVTSSPNTFHGLPGIQALISWQDSCDQRSKKPIWWGYCSCSASGGTMADESADTCSPS